LETILKREKHVPECIKPFDFSRFGTQVEELVESVLRSEVRGQRSEVRGQKSEIRSQRSEARSQKSEIRDQRSEVRDQRSEVGGRGR
jgi:hypothetical protein